MRLIFIGAAALPVGRRTDVRDNLSYFPRRCAAATLSHRLCDTYDLFGSQAKENADAGSDVDLLVEYEPGHVPGLLGFFRLEEN